MSSKPKPTPKNKAPVKGFVAGDRGRGGANGRGRGGANCRGRGGATGRGRGGATGGLRDTGKAPVETGGSNQNHGSTSGGDEANGGLRLSTAVVRGGHSGGVRETSGRGLVPRGAGSQTPGRGLVPRGGGSQTSGRGATPRGGGGTSSHSSNPTSENTQSRSFSDCITRIPCQYPSSTRQPIPRQLPFPTANNMSPPPEQIELDIPEQEENFGDFNFGVEEEDEADHPNPEEQDFEGLLDNLLNLPGREQLMRLSPHEIPNYDSIW